MDVVAPVTSTPEGPAVAPDTGSWDEDTDVVVAGAGGAGLAAACEAGTAGARVLVFEKQPRLLESSTAMSVGRFSFAGTDVQLANGVHDSDELLYSDIMEAGRRQSDPQLVRAYVDHQIDTYRWLVSLGVRWGPSVAAEAGMSLPRGHLTDPVDLVRILRDAVERQGTPVLLGTPVTALLHDAARRVTGVLVRERDGRISRVRARRAVVLATGGFARDAQRLAQIDPLLAGVAVTSGPGHTGHGLRMATELGAQLRDMEHVKPSFELYRYGCTSEDIVLLFLRGGVIVNANADRFINEAVSYKDIGMACLRQPGRVAWQIVDSRIFGAAVEEGRSGRKSPLTIDESKRRLFVRGNSIRELGRAACLPEDALVASIERYNAFVDAGHDADFGRDVLAGHYGRPVKIDAAPFYACPTVSHVLATYAGVWVRPDMAVRTATGVVPGLYAAGETVGGFHGESYTSGTGLGKALTFGRIAGMSAATAGGPPPTCSS
jgi:fumarate reductase flavoprotein subunit